MSKRTRPALITRNDLMAEWDSEANTNLDPAKITEGSGQKIRWKCSKNSSHKWETTAYNRARIGSGCPYCCGQRLTSKTTFAAKFPLIAKEWHSEKNGAKRPIDFASSSQQKIWWQCPAVTKHIYESSIANRARRGDGCPYCSNKKIDPDFSLGSLNPSLSKEWHHKNKKTPFEYAPGSGKKVWWQCAEDQNHEWQAVVGNRNRGGGCPFCLNKKVSATNSLAVHNPELLLEWDYDKNQEIDPENIVFGTHKKVWWQCQREATHSWKTSVNRRSREINPTGCPYCTSQTSAPEIRLYTELKFLFPDVESRVKIQGYEVDIFIPSLAVGIEYDGSYWHKDKEEKDANKNRNLEACGYNLVRVRCSPLKKIRTHDVLVESDQLTKHHLNELLNIIQHVSIKADLDVSNYCLQSEFQAEKDFKKYMSYLPFPFPENSLAEKRTDIASEWEYEKNYPLRPLNFPPFSHRSVWWRCLENTDHIWEAMIRDRSLGAGCPFCSGKVVEESEKFINVRPNLIPEFEELRVKSRALSDLSYKSHHLAIWRCAECDWRWESKLRDRANGQPCPRCFPQDFSNHIVRHRRKLSISEEYPELCKDWHPKRNLPLEPRQATAGISQKIWWVCQKNKHHIWETTIANRIKGNGCPYCTNKLVNSTNSLQALYPDIAKEWFFEKNKDLTPDQVVPGSPKKVWWRCSASDDHIWHTEIRGRVNANSCPFCSGRRLSKTSSLTVMYPDLAMEWHPELNKFSPEEVIPGSTKRVWWKCAKDKSHVWEAVVWKRAKAGKGCPFCAGRRR